MYGSCLFIFPDTVKINLQIAPQADAKGIRYTVLLNFQSVVLKVTKTMAKYRALKLMEEVGISDTRKRYRQYPFEFSGGLRQRIVIAIALAADPDILRFLSAKASPTGG